MNIEQIQYVTKNYCDLKGLHLVPIGLFITMYGFVQIQNGAPTSKNRPIILTSLVIIIIIHILIDKYYDKAFGKVEQHKSIALDIFMGLTAGALLITAEWSESTQMLPISSTGITIAGLLFAYWLTKANRQRNHYLVVALFVVNISLLPSGDVPLNLSMVDGYGIPLFGMICVVIGFFDHLFLTRTLKPLPHE